MSRRFFPDLGETIPGEHPIRDAGVFGGAVNPTVDASTHPTSGAELICTTALCGRPAVARVSWRTQPQALPFCRRCSDRLASHGDTVIPLPSAA
jgi:hypothetical protein